MYAQIWRKEAPPLLADVWAIVVYTLTHNLANGPPCP
jgi:hypothetical protein